jgi:hypothetical protein
LKRSRKKRFGNFVFFLPIILLVAIVLFGFYQNTENATGVLSVEAQSSYGSSSHFISSITTVSGATKQTPYDLTLKPGPYTVTYGALQWYQTPPPKTVTVLGGTTAYAVGVYVPIRVKIDANGAGFNATQVTAKSGVTPVVWTDTGNSAVQLKSTVFNIVLTPGQNYTRVFDSPDELIVSLIGTTATMTVNVA